MAFISTCCCFPNRYQHHVPHPFINISIVLLCLTFRCLRDTDLPYHAEKGQNVKQNMRKKPASISERSLPHKKHLSKMEVCSSLTHTCLRFVTYSIHITLRQAKETMDTYILYVWTACNMYSSLVHLVQDCIKLYLYVLFYKPLKLPIAKNYGPHYRNWSKLQQGNLRDAYTKHMERKTNQKKIHKKRKSMHSSIVAHVSKHLHLSLMHMDKCWLCRECILAKCK